MHPVHGSIGEESSCNGLIAPTLQGYISVLDEDLGKAQERIGSALADDDDSAAKQNEMLKAAAKQVSPGS